MRWTIPTGKEVLQFHFHLIEIGKLTAEELRQTGLTGLLPLLILTKDGATREVAEEIVTGLGAAKKKESLPAVYILLSLVFESKADREWLRRRLSEMHDLMQDSWAYQEMTKEAREEGLQEGIQKGLQEGRQQQLHALRQMLLQFVRSRFFSSEDDTPG